MSWLSANLGNIAVILILFAAVCLSIHTIVSDKRRGKSSCGSHCGTCPMSGSCHHDSPGGKRKNGQSDIDN